MCGIAGIVYRQRERPVSESLLRRMCAAVAHRGPDDEGLYLQGAVGLGMRRLSIIDLSGGRPPNPNQDGAEGVVFQRGSGEGRGGEEGRTRGAADHLKK